MSDSSARRRLSQLGRLSRHLTAQLGHRLAGLAGAASGRAHGTSRQRDDRSPAHVPMPLSYERILALMESGRVNTSSMFLEEVTETITDPDGHEQTRRTIQAVCGPALIRIAPLQRSRHWLDVRGTWTPSWEKQPEGLAMHINDWNRDHLVPTLSFTPEEDSITIEAAYIMDMRAGVTDEQLIVHLGGALHSMDQAFTYIEEAIARW